MQGKQSGQIDIFNQMIYESLIPKDHLLLQIEKIVSFDFVYDKVKERYSKLGRESYDPVLMFKICLLQYLYNLSDREVATRMQTDIAFRWFLKLELSDKVPDYTTISHYRIKRLGEKEYDEIFKSIVGQCIDYGLIKTKRYIVDTTNVDAKVNYPSPKKLICQGYYRLIKEVCKIDKQQAELLKNNFEQEIEELNKTAQKLEETTGQKESIKVETYCEIARKYAEQIYLRYSKEILNKRKLGELFNILWEVIKDYSEGSDEKDRIISVVDPDARIAHKRRGVRKRGYKNHIIVDEDSEIILSSIETPFNVPDQKKLEDLIEKVEKDYDLKPEEISADKVYSSINNRVYLKDKKIKGNIMFYDFSGKEQKSYDPSLFEVSEDLTSAICPNKCYTKEFKIIAEGTKISIKFSEKDCYNCPLREACISRSSLKKKRIRKILTIPIRYDAIMEAIKINRAEGFIEAINKRYIVERRFATLVRNHGLRVSRYYRLKGASIHIKMANMACNIIRMVRLLTIRNHLGEVVP